MMIFFAICGGIFFAGLGALLLCLSYAHFREIEDNKEYKKCTNRQISMMNDVVRWCGNEFPQIEYFCNAYIPSLRHGFYFNSSGFREDMRAGHWDKDFKPKFHERWCETRMVGYEKAKTVICTCRLKDVNP